MESFKILSISKTAGSAPLSSRDSTEVWYVFTLMYGHESFQVSEVNLDILIFLLHFLRILLGISFKRQLKI